MKKFLKCAGLVLVSGFLVLAAVPAAMATVASPNNDLESIAMNGAENCLNNDLVNNAQDVPTAAGAWAVVTKEEAVALTILCLSPGFSIAPHTDAYFTDVRANCMLKNEKVALASEDFKLKASSLAGYLVPIIATNMTLSDQSIRGPIVMATQQDLRKQQLASSGNGAGFFVGENYRLFSIN
jgi:hypothetical protein